MSRPSRVRRWLKRGGLILSALVVAAWVVSLPFAWYASKKTAEHDWSLALANGHFYFSTFDWMFWPERWSCDVARSLDQTGWTFYVNNDTPCSVELPCWLLFLVVASPTAYLFWQDRHFPPGRCQSCNYDLTGNMSEVCPECGKKLSKPAIPSCENDEASEEKDHQI